MEHFQGTFSEQKAPLNYYFSVFSIEIDEQVDFHICPKARFKYTRQV